MTRGGRYAAALALIAGAAALAAVARSGADREGILVGAGAGLLIQAPLGWWVVRSVGSDHFLGAWMAGFLARIALLALMALVVVPAARLAATPVLVTLAAVLGGLLLAEGAAAMAKTSQQPQTGTIR